jgi:hypothetical protein
MVNYVFFDKDGVIQSLLEFDKEPQDIQPFIDSQNISLENKIVSFKKILEEDKFWGVGMKLYDNVIKPVKPYDSWIWDDMLDIWIAPNPHPSIINSEDTKHYEWEESTLSWNLVK